MKLHTRSVVQLHDLYHRREGERYIVGDPETGEYTFVTAAELRALQLLNSGLTVAHVRELLKDEKERVELEPLLVRLNHKRLVHRIDSRVLSPTAEPIMEFSLPARLFGNVAVKFVLTLICLFGAFTLMWRGTIPGPGLFLYQESLTLALLAGIVVAWVFVFIRQIAKYGQATYLGLPARFGFRMHYYLALPVAHIPPATEEQHRRVVGTGLLALLAAVGAAAFLASWFSNGFWSFVFLIGILELVSECFLFLDTDLGRYIGYRADVHRLNEQTAMALREEWRLLWRGRKQDSHPSITAYSFLYLASMLWAVFIAIVYLIPIAFDVFGTAFARFVPGGPLEADAMLALLFLTINLFAYGFSSLRRHPLAHNSLFVNTSVLCIVFASFLAASVVARVVSYSDTLLASLILYALGVVLAFSFERALRLAHPFSELHTVFESFILPIIAACVPLSILFTVAGGAVVYLMAAMLAVGMLTAISLREMVRTMSWHRGHPLR